MGTDNMSSASSAGNQTQRQHDKQVHNEELEELMRKEFSSLRINSSRPKDIQGSRRRLLLIYIHGFLGSEQSFRSFPAHIHSLLRILLEETHVVHSKIYPRYKSKQYIRVARDEFSRWLKPHESPETDVILLGHSMGGLISAEVALMPPANPGEDAFMHRIIGILNFDVPFLGMHPGVVRSGLASIFVPAKDPEDKYQTRSIADHAMAQFNVEPNASSDRGLDSDDSSFWETQDGNFNEAFSNDVVLPERKFWQSVAHFVRKHGRDVASATQNVVTSHIEFMSAMSNSKELRSRYSKVRVLEEDNEMLRRSIVKCRRAPPRIRFANYYTVSTGRVKPDEEKDGSSPSLQPEPTKPSEVPDLDNAKGDEFLVAPPSDSNASSTASDSSTLALPFGETKVASRPSSKRPKSSHSSRSKSPRPAKQGTFCNLPPKDAQGELDPTWVRMFMEDVDEVGAHCGMFFVDERYERFVGDVASRIEDWVRNDLSVRAAQAALTID